MVFQPFGVSGIEFHKPLYVAGFFLDRLLPLMKPYMINNEDGSTMHPDRYPEKGEQGIVVFSAAGFPDVEHNFDGLKATLRSWSSHSEHAWLMGEFFLPAAELIAQPVYADRLERIRQTCFSAGRQVVEQGRIDQALMESVQDTGVTRESFQDQANLFWESLDGRKAYLAGAPQIN